MTTENTTPDPAAEEAAAAAAQAAAAEADKNKAPLSLEGDDPAAKPPITKTEEQPAPKGDEVPAVTYNPTGDAGLDMVLKFVGDLGYDPKNPAMAAAMEGDFTMLEAELASKGVKGADAYIKLGQQAFTRTRAATAARQAADRKAVTDIAGGEDGWVAVQAWARANATPEEAKEFSVELQAGGVRARNAAAYLKTQFDRAQGSMETEGEGKPVAKAKGAADNTGALSPREYAKEVAKARIGFKGDFENSATYKSLQSRRMAYRG